MNIRRMKTLVAEIIKKPSPTLEKHELPGTKQVARRDARQFLNDFKKTDLMSPAEEKRQREETIAASAKR